MTGRLRGEGLKGGRLHRPRALCAPSGKAANRPRPTSKLSADRQAGPTLLASPRRGEGKRAPIGKPSLLLAFAVQGRYQCKPSAIGKPSGGQARRGAGPLPGQARCHKGKRAPIASDGGGGPSELNFPGRKQAPTLLVQGTQLIHKDF